MTLSYPDNDAGKLAWKQMLKNACLDILHKRIANIEAAISEARESANSEEKSSAGDKYETSRAMGHLTQEMQSHQLHEALQELEFVKRLTISALCEMVVAGAVVVCRHAVFYVSFGAGNIEVEGQKIMLLSPRAPLAVLLYHKKKHEIFTFNSNTIEILDVF